jgi:hypothetical protein
MRTCTSALGGTEPPQSSAAVWWDTIEPAGATRSAALTRKAKVLGARRDT